MYTYMSIYIYIYACMYMCVCIYMLYVCKFMQVCIFVHIFECNSVLLHLFCKWGTSPFAHPPFFPLSRGEPTVG